MFNASTESILKNFPFETPREGQVEIVKFILDSFDAGKKFVAIEVPCGGGKSAIALAVAKFFKDSYYLTIQKILQDQLTNEFGEGGKFSNLLVDLKGRNAYECTYYRLNAERLKAKKIITLQQYHQYKERKYDCAEGYCRSHGSEHALNECKATSACPYLNQLEKAMNSDLCLMNFAGFLAQTTFTDRFNPRQLMILDEAHNIESQLLSFISATLSERDFDIVFPQFDLPEEYAEWFDKSGIIEKLQAKIREALYADDPKRADEFVSLKQKMEWFISEMTKEDHDPWICEYAQTDRGVKLTLKPVYIKSQARKYLFNMADYVLMMSATILNVNVMARSLGIEKHEIAAKRTNSRFPVENRPIYYQPVVKVTGGKNQMHVWGPPIIEATQEIIRKYPDKKGIIHTHNFAIAQMLMDNCDPEIESRLLFQKNFGSKNEMLEVHGASKNTIIVAPAMHEGLDLVGDLSRFQIICKVPFPNFYEDKQLAARKDDDPQFYDWLTALKLVQSAGRSIRSNKDWADTYILDQAFGWWYEQNKGMIPIWFKEAIIR